MKKMQAAITKDETGKTYGFLKVIRKATEEEKPRTDRAGVYWVCNCTNCGRENVIIFGDYLRNGDTKSCGCITSINESKIAKMLTNGNINFKEQYRFKDLSSTGRECDCLIFDFAIYNKDMQSLIYLIEFDGSQHFKYFYKENNKGWNNEDTFKTTRQNDLIKNKYCFEHNIPLIRIPYNKEYTFEDLKLETTRFLLTPENEQEYYN